MASEDMEELEESSPGGISRFRWWLLGLVGVVTMAAVGVRVFAAEEGRPTGQKAAAEAEQERQESLPGGASGFLPGGTQAPGGGEPAEQEPQSKAEEIAPIVTEAGLFAFLGFTIGYAARKLLKVGFFLIAIFFAGLQGLSYAGVLTIDWGRGLSLINDFVLNIGTGETVTDILKHHVPSAASLAGGYFLGFRRG